MLMSEPPLRLLPGSDAVKAAEHTESTFTDFKRIEADKKWREFFPAAKIGSAMQDSARRSKRAELQYDN
jgi:hypothetical protein